MLNALCDELDKRVAASQGVAPTNAPHILISGSPMAIPNWKLHHIIESAGAVIVCEESCTRTRSFSDLVKPTKERLVVTGYGRHLVAPSLGAEAVTEIKAFAVGARFLSPDCHTVIDIGGQDSKVILLSEKGEVQKFEMNDRCAAGTGKFLEVMSHTLGVGIAEIGDLALSAKKKIQINSLCTVFAESEVVSLIAKVEAASSQRLPYLKLRFYHCKVMQNGYLLVFRGYHYANIDITFPT
jgi:hypothetical protein